MHRPLLHLRGARLVTMNARREVFTGDMTIENGRIAAIGRDLPVPADATVIEAQGLTLIPGLIQTHIHLCQTLFRGLADDLLLLDWLKQRIWPLEGGHDAESLALSCDLGLGELLRGGTTTIVDMATVHHTDTVFERLERSGIRAIAGKCMMDVGPEVPKTLLETTEDSMRESLALLERWHGRDDGRLRYAFTPRFAVSCSEELMRQVRDAAERHGVHIHTHSSENQDELALVMRETGRRNVAYFEHLGMTGSRLILAHCVWLDEEEKEILARTGTAVAHCPSSNLKLGSGIAPIPDLLARGVKVSLGADGAPCNNNLDGFAEMRLASLIQKPFHGTTSMPAPLVFELATIRGAEALGMASEIGSLEVGKRADLAGIDLEQLHTLPGTEANVYSQLVYAARSSDVRLTVVDGRVLYQDGQLLTIDEAEVKRQVPEVLKRLLVRAGVEPALLR